MENSYAVHPDNWSFMVGVDINLFEGGSSRADLRKTAYRKQRLVEQRAKLVDEVKLEVKRYFLDLQNAYERIQVTYDVLDQAQETSASTGAAMRRAWGLQPTSWMPSRC